MAQSNLQDTSLRCASCGAMNYPFAAFCISCGQPIGDEEDTASSVARDPLAAYNPFRSSSEAEVEPQPDAARPRITRLRLSRWETALGLAIVLLTLGYVVFDWQRNLDQGNAYRAGIAAASSKDWVKAINQFASAGDHADAVSRKQEAERKLGDRDHLYRAGVSALDNREWDTAVADLKAVDAIQPNYQDSARLLAQAKQGLTKAKLDGIAYLVSDRGTTPGLYVRAAGKDIRLPGSDQDSNVYRVNAGGSNLIYDRPSDEWDYLTPLNHRSIVQDQFGRDPSDRIMVLARLPGNKAGERIMTKPLPELGLQGSRILANEGFWWIGSTVDTTSAGNTFYFSPLSGDTYKVKKVTSESISEDSSRNIIAFDPAHSRIVSEEIVGVPGFGGYESKLYLADADGSNERLLPSLPGRPGIIWEGAIGTRWGEVAISSNGKWLLCATQSSTIEYIWALSLANDGPPQLLDTIPSVEPKGNPPRLKAVFVPSRTTGDHTRVLVSSPGTDTEKLTLYDLDDGGSANVEGVMINPADKAAGKGSTSFSHNGQYMASRRYTGITDTLELLGISPRSLFKASVDLHAIGNRTVITQFSPHDDYVLVYVMDPYPAHQGSTTAIYAAPIVKNSLGPLRQIATSNGDMYNISLSSEGSLLAYINTSQELHAVSLDGTGDALIATNVRIVWRLTDESDLFWWLR